MAITATFSADFSRWNEGLKNAQASLKSFELSTVGVKQQLQRMVSGLDGSKIIRDAQVAAAAVEKIGGVAKLTANEQKRLSATVDEALAKYRALGEEAPKELLGLEHELKNVAKAQKDISGGVDKSALDSLKGLKEGATESSGALSLLGGTMKLAFGAAALGGIITAGKSVLDFAGHLTDLSQQTGISTDGLQTLGAVGKKVGLSMDDIGNAVSQMSKRLGGGDDSAVGAVQKLGLNLQELINLAPDKAFERIAAAIGEVENPMLRTKLATELLGKAGAQALPLLTSELGKLRDAAKDSGEVIDTETVKAMDDLGDSWEDMKTIGAVLLANVMRPMVPVLHAIAEGAKEASAAFRKDWVEQTNNLAEAWKKLKETVSDLPTAMNKLVNANFGGSFDAFADSAAKAAQGTNDVAAAQRGSISATDLANNRLKALREEAMAPLTAEQKKLIAQLDKFGESNKDIADSVGSNQIAVKLYLDVVKELEQETKEAAKKQKELSDALSGKEAVEGLRRLVAAWKATPEAIRQTTAAQNLFLDQWDKLGPTLTRVPAQLAGTVKQFNAMSLAAGKFSVTKVVAGLKSLDGIAEEVKASMADVFASWLAFENDLNTSKRVKIGDIIGSAFKLDDRIETNFINQITDLQDRLVLVNHKGQERQLIQLEISKRKELEAIRSNTQLTEEEYRKMASIVEGIYKQLEKEVTGTFGSRFKDGIKNAAVDIATALPQIIAGAISGDLRGQDLGEALGATIGAGIGLAIGAAFGGPIGAAIGASAGAAVGQGIAEIFSTKAEQHVRQIARTFGAHIGEDLGQAIADTAKFDFDGDQIAAQLAHFGDILKEGGGLTVKNIDLMTAKLHDVFSAIEGGAFDAADGMKVLDDVFAQFAAFVTKDGALASAKLLDIIKLNKQFGTNSAAVADFVAAQTSRAIGGLTTFLENASVTSSNAAKSIGAAVFAAFGSLQEGGASPLEALAQVTPVLEKLDAQLKASGIDGGAAFAQMRDLAVLAKDAVAGPLITAIASLNDVFEGLHNSGMLNQEMFSGLAQQVGETYQKLVAAGKGGDQALQLIAPTLQTLFELQQDFGYQVDASTQALIDQGVAAGKVGNEHRTAQEKMLQALERTADAVEGLAHAFGVTLASDIDKTTEAIKRIPRDIKVGIHYEDSGFREQPTGPTGGTGTRRTFAEGGVVSMAAYKASKVSQYLASGGPVHKAVGALAASALLATAMPSQAMASKSHASPAAMYAATGAFVAQGTDTVPAMLTPGEYVLPTKVVQKEGLPKLEALRDGQATIQVYQGGANQTMTSPSVAGGTVARYATGGLVDRASSLDYLRQLPDEFIKITANLTVNTDDAQRQLDDLQKQPPIRINTEVDRASSLDYLRDLPNQFQAITAHLDDADVDAAKKALESLHKQPPITVQADVDTAGAEKALGHLPDAVPRDVSMLVTATETGLTDITTDIQALPQDQAFRLRASSDGLAAIVSNIANIPIDRAFELLASSDGLEPIVDGINAIPTERAFQVLASARGLREITADVQAIQTERDFRVIAVAVGLQAIVDRVNQIPTERDLLVLVRAAGIDETLAAINTIPTERDVAVPVQAFGVADTLAAIATIPQQWPVAVPVTVYGLDDALEALSGIPSRIPADIILTPVARIAVLVDAILAQLARIPDHITVAVNTNIGSSPQPTPAPPGNWQSPLPYPNPGSPLPTPLPYPDPRFPLPNPLPYPGGGFGTGGGSGGRFAQGGIVPDLYAAMGRFIPHGTDTVLAGLTPGEGVLNTKAMAVVGAPLLNQWNRQPDSLSRLIQTATQIDASPTAAIATPLVTQTPVAVTGSPSASGNQPAAGGAHLTVHMTIQTLDGADTERVVRSPAFRKALVSAIDGNEGGYRTDIRRVIGVR